MRILELTGFLCACSVCRQCSSTKQIVTYSSGPTWGYVCLAQSQPHSHSIGSVLWAPVLASVLGCLLQGMWFLFQTLGAAVLGLPGQLRKESPQRSLGKVWLWRIVWPFPSPPSSFLLPGARALSAQLGGKPQSKNWRINSFSALCQSVKCWKTRPCAPC